MTDTITQILEGLRDMMDQAHKRARESKTDRDKVEARGRFEAFCEVQDMIREIMEEER